MYFGRADVARLLIDRGANVHERERVVNKGGSLLHIAARGVICGDGVAVTRLLVDHGVDVSETGDNGKAPLHVAAARGNADVASFLLDRGADIDQPGSSKASPLHFAVAEDHADVARLLLRRGADINKGPVTRGLTPLSLARYTHACGGAPAGSAAALVLSFEAAREVITNKLHADIWLRVVPFGI